MICTYDYSIFFFNSGRNNPLKEICIYYFMSIFLGQVFLWEWAFMFIQSSAFSVSAVLYHSLIRLFAGGLSWNLVWLKFFLINDLFLVSLSAIPCSQIGETSPTVGLYIPSFLNWALPVTHELDCISIWIFSFSCFTQNLPIDIIGIIL